jgi:putative holliday junction resolvase
MIGQGRVLGVDLGSRRIGVAVTDDGQRVATGLTTLVRASERSKDHSALAALVAEHGAVGVVVGVPLSLSGEIGRAAKAALEEVEEIRAVGLEVDTVDERFTTAVVSDGMRAGGRSTRAQRQVVDQEAAAALLQTWADVRRRTAERDA